MPLFFLQRTARVIRTAVHPYSDSETDGGFDLGPEDPTLPEAWGFGGWQYLGITTTYRQQGIQNVVPSDFNPRPKTNPN